MSPGTVPAAILLHSITAWIFGLKISRGFWYTAIMAPMFISSALVSGLGLVILMALAFRRVGAVRFGGDLSVLPFVQKIVEEIALRIAQYRFEGGEMQRHLRRGVEEMFDPGRIERLSGQTPLPADAPTGPAADLDLAAGRRPSCVSCLDAVATGHWCGKCAAKAPGRTAAAHGRQCAALPRRIGDQ